MSAPVMFRHGGDGYWMPLYGVHRHQNYGQRVGFYVVIHTVERDVSDFFNFWSCQHREAVVDDFGSLVSVGPMGGAA